MINECSLTVVIRLIVIILTEPATWNTIQNRKKFFLTAIRIVLYNSFYVQYSSPWQLSRISLLTFDQCRGSTENISSFRGYTRAFIKVQTNKFNQILSDFYYYLELIAKSTLNAECQSV